MLNKVNNLFTLIKGMPATFKAVTPKAIAVLKSFVFYSLSSRIDLHVLHIWVHTHF